MNIRSQIFLFLAVIGLIGSCGNRSEQPTITVKTGPSVAVVADSNTLSYVSSLKTGVFEISVRSELRCSNEVKLDSQNKLVAVKPDLHPEKVKLIDDCDFELIRQTIQFSESGTTFGQFSNREIIQELRKAFPGELFDFQSVAEYVYLLDNGLEKFAYFRYNSGLSGEIHAIYSMNGKLKWLKMASKEWIGETKKLKEALTGLHFSTADQMADNEGYFNPDYLQKCQSLTIIHW